MTKSRHRKNCDSVKLEERKASVFLSRGSKWQQSSLNIQIAVILFSGDIAMTNEACSNCRNQCYEQKVLSQGAHFHGIKTSYQIFLLFALLFTRKVSSLCSLHCYGCCSCQVMLMYPGWHPSTVTRIKLQAEGDCIQAWPQALVLVAAVVARLDGRLVGY